MLRYSSAGGENAMQTLKFVLTVEGKDTEMNCAIPEILDIIRGYGGKPVDLVKEYTTEVC